MGITDKPDRLTGFPNLARLTINFGTDDPSLTLQAYMALTLNSVQAGASASVAERSATTW